jgi:phosphotriesterase-related protein
VACWLGRQTPAIKKMIEASPNNHYAHISKNILPAMRKMGVSEEKIRTLMVDNPKNYFGGH